MEQRKVFIKQIENGSPYKTPQSERLEVVDENGKVIGKVLHIHNVCLSLGQINIELVLNCDDEEKQ